VAQKPVLGKGLASLLPSAAHPAAHTTPAAGATVAGPPAVAHQSQSDASNRDRHLGISMVALEEVRANQLQPRRDFDDLALKELAQSIQLNGIIQPLLVRKTAKDGYELIAGERRLRAAKLAGLKQVPIVIRRSTDRESLELALIENIQRQNLNCIDEALAYFQLIQDFSLTQEEVAERVGKDRATVANYLRLLRLPEIVIDDLKKGVLTFGHGKALLGLEDADQRLRARAQIIEKRLSVRETEALVDSMKAPKEENTGTNPQSASKSPLTSRLSNLSRDLARQWSTKVEVKGNEQKGKIVIHYTSRQDLDRILEAMQTE
jgi:ParB family chromosome partitioning protein